MQTKTTTATAAGLYKHTTCALPSQLNRDKTKKKRRRRLTEGAQTTTPSASLVPIPIMRPLQTHPHITPKAEPGASPVTSLAPDAYTRIDEP